MLIYRLNWEVKIGNMTGKNEQTKQHMAVSIHMLSVLTQLWALPRSAAAWNCSSSLD